MIFHPILLSAIALATQVHGHGFPAELTVEGKTYKGNRPAEGHGRKTNSVIWQIHNISPIQDLQDPDLACGPKAAKSDLVADVNPGDNIQMNWVGGSSGETNWIHRVGPILTYMASCGDKACSEFDVTKAKWFKISELVKNSKGEWYQDEVYRGKPTNVQIPSTLAPGNYIFRQEIIALHNGNRKGGAEIFPSCSQLRVGGSQKGKPTKEELVSIPGVYTSDEPGIWAKKIYDTGSKYTAPGPPIAKLGGDSSDDSSESPTPDLPPKSSQTEEEATSKPTKTKTTSKPTKTGNPETIVTETVIVEVTTMVTPTSTSVDVVTTITPTPTSTPTPTTCKMALSDHPTPPLESTPTPSITSATSTSAVDLAPRGTSNPDPWDMKPRSPPVLPAPLRSRHSRRATMSRRQLH